MLIGSIKENLSIEQRIAITPDIAKKYLSLGLEVFLPENYGEHLGFKSSEYNEAFKQYLESRLYKSEAYATFSAVVAVVLEMQLEIKSIPSLLVKYPIIYFISATENAYDLYHHIETASKGVSGEISQEIIIKLT